MLSCATIGLFIQSNTQQTLPFQIEKALIVVLFLGLGIFYRIYEPRTEKYFRPLYLLIELINNTGIIITLWKNISEYRIFKL